MQIYPELNFNTQERLFHCHWSPESQRFASGGALLTLMDHEWEITDVHEECLSMSTGRYTIIMTFKLKKGLMTLEVPMVATPLVQKLACQVRGAMVPEKEALPVEARTRAKA